MPTVSENPEVEQHYLAQAGVTAALMAALRELWPAVEPLSGARALLDYRTGVVTLVQEFAQAASVLSADYYEALRESERVPGAFRVNVPPPPSVDRINADLDRALGDMQAEMDAEFEAIMRRVDAQMQKLVADSGRGTLMGALAGDEKATGFARVARPGACAFCLMLAMRGAVYKSRQTAGQLPPNATGQVNRYHYNCNCQVQPLFAPRGEYEFPPHIVEAQELYDKATEHSKRNQGLKDFRRALEAIRRGDEPEFAAEQSGGVPQSVKLDRLNDILDGFGL